MLIELRDVEPKMTSGRYEVIPPGVYRICVSSAELTQSKSKRDMIVVHFLISEGAYKAKELRHYFSIESKPGKAAFSCLLTSLFGKRPAAFDTEQIGKLIGKECLTVTYIEVEGGFKRCRIQCFYSLDQDEQAQKDFEAQNDVAEDVPF